MPTLNDIRASFLDYFQARDHQVLPSGPLVPFNDPTLLFTNSGMVQFKDVFTGRQTRTVPRAATAQKCVRAGGKHNDLDNVGYTARHHTFFEMLGNFSFGDYFKELAIPLAWELVVKEFDLAPERLLVTVFAEDDAAADIWRKVSGFGDDRILRISTADNFWMMGSTGPCGPCSEIFYDHGEDVPGGPPGSPDEDGDRFVEIWNLVFMQFEQFDDARREALPHPSIDTGMGLERIGAVLQGKRDNYDTDLFQAIIEASGEASNTEPYGDRSLHHRVIADHLRSTCFLIADGVLPSNEGRGYVLRRIMRRAMRHAHLLGTPEPMVWQLVPVLVRKMGQAFPELEASQGLAEETLRLEETKFRETLQRGLSLLDQEVAKLGDQEPLSGEVVFKLFDTYGFPVDLTQDALREQGRQIDLPGFEAAMAAQRERSRAARGAGGQTGDEHAALWFALNDTHPATEFLGYRTEQATGQVLELVRDGERVAQATDGERISVVVNQSPFYAEAGGQVGDHGVIVGENGQGIVIDTQRRGALIEHVIESVKGTLATGDAVTLTVDATLRAQIRCNHSATHLLHESLREHLGTHVEQRGSLVAADRLRFDFAHNHAIDDEMLRKIESSVNDHVRQNSEVNVRVMAIDDAMATGARALFGEKYGDEVRVVTMGHRATGDAYSVELCGGTHVQHTGAIGLFKVVGEDSVSAGIRRVEALTGAAALEFVSRRDHVLRTAATALRVRPDEVGERVSALMSSRRQLENELAELRRQVATGEVAQGAGEVRDIAGVPFWARHVHDVEPKDLRGIVDACRGQLPSGVIAVVAETGGKAAVVVGVSDDLVDRLSAVDLVRAAAKQLGGSGGGGRRDLAQAGGPDTSRVKEAVIAIEQAMSLNEEATINNVLADVLRLGNPRWRGQRGSVEAERLHALDDGGKPDLLLLDRGAAPVIAELEFYPARTVEQNAASRLGRVVSESQQVVEHVVAIRAPADLRNISQRKLLDAVRAVEFEYCLLSTIPNNNSARERLPAAGWLKGNVEDIATLLENVSLSGLVTKSFEILREAVGKATDSLASLANEKVADSIAAELYQHPSDQTYRMAITILANALLFHTAIARDFEQIEQPNVLVTKLGKPSPHRILEAWNYIISEINYRPIFIIASKILGAVPSEEASSILDVLVDATSTLDSSGVTRSHDITGRMFQRLVSDLKIHGTYCIRPEAARMLAEIAVGMIEVKWGNADAVSELRVGDLACGTGTLLSSAHHSIIANHRRRNGDDSQIRWQMMQESLIATDIMPVATHLTTAMLSSVHPTVTFEGTQVFTLPYGKSEVDGAPPLGLGALDLIMEESGIDLLDSTKVTRIHGSRRSTEDSAKDFSLPHGSLNLIIMKPPFRRSIGLEAEKIGVPVSAFARLGSGKTERDQMSAKLNTIRRKLSEPAGHRIAGLASNFVDLAHIKLSAKGILALVLPLAMVKGESWTATRALLEKHYENIILLTLSGPKNIDLSFSENPETGKGEVFVIARKRKRPNRNTDNDVCWVSLNRRPTSICQAVEYARKIRSVAKESHPYGNIKLGEEQIGSYIMAPIRHGGCAPLSDSSLASVMLELGKGRLCLPNNEAKLDISITTLSELRNAGLPPRKPMKLTGSRGCGPVAPKPSREELAYRGRGHHHIENEQKRVVEPEQQLVARPDVWDEAHGAGKTAARLYLNKELNWTSQSRSAHLTQSCTLGGAWYNCILSNDTHKPLVELWANSTLGLMSFWWEGTRQRVGWSRNSNTSLENMLTINANVLSKAKIRQAQSLSDQFSSCKFLPPFRADQDEVRQALDRELLVGLLELPEEILKSVRTLRRKWCMEPSVNAGKDE